MKTEKVPSLTKGKITFWMETLYKLQVLPEIDADLILLMSEEELSRYITRHGDRLRLKNFLTRFHQEKKQDNKIKRKEILAALRKKIEDRRRSRKAEAASSSEIALEDKKPRQSSSRNVQKNELRGLHTEVHMRIKRGGGNRKISIRKDATKTDLLEEGKRLLCSLDGKDGHNTNWKTIKDPVKNPDETKNAETDELPQNNICHREELTSDSESDQDDILQRAITLAGILDEINDQN